MGWPRKNEQARIYQDRDKSYFIVCPDLVTGWGDMDGLANVFRDSEPCLCSTSINPAYISHYRLRRVSWSELPKVWRRAFRERLVDSPRAIRGFWKMGERPKRRKHATK